MKYEHSEWNKHFGMAEYKITFTNGRVIQTKGWKFDDGDKTQIIPTVIKRIANGRRK